MPLSSVFVTVKLVISGHRPFVGDARQGYREDRDKMHVLCLGAGEVGVTVHFGLTLAYWLVGLPRPGNKSL